MWSSPPTARAFAARRLFGDRIDAAFPLARLAAEDLTLAGWRRFARNAGADDVLHRRRPARGLLGVEDASGYLHALCTFAVEPDLRHGSRLRVDDIVVVNLTDRAKVVGALARGLAQIARDLGCAMTRLPDALADGAAMTDKSARPAARLRPVRAR